MGINSVIQEKEATLRMKALTVSNRVVKVTCRQKGLATHWGRDQAVLSVPLGNGVAVLERGWDSFIMK